MIEMFHLAFDKLIETGATPTIQAIAAWVTITRPGVSLALSAIYRHFTSQGPPDAAGPEEIGQGETVFGDVDELCDVLNNESVMKHLVLPVMATQEMGMLKAFHSMHPNMLTYIGTIDECLGQCDSEGKWHELGRFAEQMVEAIWNHNEGTQGAFDYKVMSLSSDGYEPLLDSLWASAVPRSDQAAQNAINRLRQWRGKHYSGKPSKWLVDHSFVRSKIQEWHEDERRQLGDRHPDLFRRLENNVLDYLGQRNQFMLGAFTLATKLFMVCAYYDLLNEKPSPGGMDVAELTSLRKVRYKFGRPIAENVVTKADDMLWLLLGNIATGGVNE